MSKSGDGRIRSAGIRSVKARTGVIRSGIVKSGIVRSGRYQAADPRRSFAAINSFLLRYELLISQNPCVSPDFCLDWTALKAAVASGSGIERWGKSAFETKQGRWMLLEHKPSGDHAWRLELKPGEQKGPADLEQGVTLADGSMLYPASFRNLLALKNLIQSFDPGSTIFPSATDSLGQKTLGIGARFTTLHWPAVEWAMAALGIGMTANQNSIPRELVYNVDAMLAKTLDTVPFPFIGTSVPEGHQGQSVEGMSHGCVLSKLKYGFHKRRIAWSFNADHQPIGGKFDDRELDLVNGCVLASYITFDLSPELSQSPQPADPKNWVASNLPKDLLPKIQSELSKRNLSVEDGDLFPLLAYVWPSIKKMKARDQKYAEIRERLFTEPQGRAYLRELSIDELPGLTSPQTTAVMLALCQALDMQIHFIAPAFGFQKNLPYPDNSALQEMIQAQWNVCKSFGTSIGFHSGSGKSAENYKVMGEVTGGRLEIKTSGRYTYEMGKALHASSNQGDRMLWDDWYDFTVEMALESAFSEDGTEQKMARNFIVDALHVCDRVREMDQVFTSPEKCRSILESLARTPENMFWFEYNFLFVLAARGRSEKAALGDHTVAGYMQRARFYAISPEARLLYSKNVASYIIFLARNTGLVSAEVCDRAAKKLAAYTTIDALLDGISG